MIPRNLTAVFPRHLRERGDEYAADGRVRIDVREHDALVATVEGARSYETTVERRAGLLRLVCSCPYAADNGVCKHLWALLVVADAEGALDALVLDFETGGNGRSSLPIALGEGDASRPELPRLPREAPPPVSHRRPPEWRRVLDYARAAAVPEEPAKPWPANRRLLYLLDLEATRASADGLVIQLATERQRSDGTWTEPRPYRIRTDVWDSVTDPADRLIAQLLRGAERASGWAPRPETSGNGFALGRAAFDTTLRLLCESGRCFVERDRSHTDAEPLRWDGGAPWRFRLHVARAGADFALGGILTRDGASMELGEPELLHACGLLVAHGEVARFDHGGNYALASALRGEPSPVAVRADELGSVLAGLYDLPRAPEVELPDGIVIAETDATPIAAVRIEGGAPTWGVPKHRVRLTFDYDGLEVDGHRGGGRVFDQAQLRVIRRDREFERAARARLVELGVREERDWRRGASIDVIAESRLDGMIDALLRDGWRVVLDGVRQRHPTGLRARVTSGIDWFALDGQVAFGDATAGLPEILQAVRARSHTVVLSDGSRGQIPDDWRKRLAPLVAAAGMAGAGAGTGAGAHFRPTQALLLDALLATMPDVDVDEQFARARVELRDFERVEPLDPPPEFVGTLRGYQREALGWFGFLRRFGLGGCLADDMGLGKTIQVLALLAGRRGAGHGPSLVVVPRSLVFNWKEEARRFVPGLRLLDHTGAQRQREAIDLENVDLLLTTYGTLRRDAAALRGVEFDYVILDEAQAIKNATTASSKAARLLRGRHRLALTGTPIENRLEELWSLLEFLNPGMLGGATAFRTMVRRGAASSAGQGAADEGRTLLSRALRPVILRRTKALVASDLPERTEQTLVVELEEAQRAVYDELLDHYRRSLLPEVARNGMARSKMQVLEALLRLRQAACHPALIDPAQRLAPSAKLDALLPMLAEITAEGHKALVFSQFTSFLALLRDRLDSDGLAYAYLDGRTRDRQAAVDRFQAPDGPPLFLISLRAGGHGLNLTAAGYVYLLDPWWNPAVEAQAIDRAHRIGQTQRVFATRLVAHDTIEEKVLELQRSKRELADAILTEDRGALAGIGIEELEALLG